MELKLYDYIWKNFLKEEIDLFDKNIQEKIEAYNKSIGLDEEILDRIRKYLKEYNRFLETQKISPVKLRYYQLLALYFTEAYFLNRDNKGFEDFSQNALAYWMATGSGKTIIMHINIFQFIEHNKGFKDLELIITTPGVNLIHQHEREITPLVEHLNKLHRNKIKVIIDTTQGLLASIEKTSTIFDFPDDRKRQRLILVDEAHIGLGKSQKDDEGKFLQLRRKLNIKHSFLFEYSATFHNIDGNLEKEYSKSIIYDYNYNLFYRDGYGKDFYFEKVGSDVLKKNFNDNLELNLNVINNKLEVFQKLQYRVIDLFHAESFPDRPLIAFMGNTVNEKKNEGKGDDELSDISEIVKYLAELHEEKRAEFKHVFNGGFKGKLKLTRSEDDEILLSYGNGDYWGIINVGNGLDFINNFSDGKGTANVIIKDKEKYLFRNIDKPESPINVLIGSRKFAEGWNCFRVSVIGLINLGKTKGNKIIQIFGRGVRLKGLNNDGKRKGKEQHIEDYFSLKNNDADNLKKLETLCVFSLQKSYLEVFTEAVSRELDITKTFEIPVKPSILKFNGTNTEFEKYSDQLKIFKLSRVSIDVKKVILIPQKQKVEYGYLYEGKYREGSFGNFLISLDYRTKKNGAKRNIRNDLKNANETFSAFINHESFHNAVKHQSFESGLQIYSKNGSLSQLSVKDVLSFIYEIFYSNDFPEFDLEFIERTNSHVAEDFIRKLKNKINWHLNSSIYVYNEKLKQSTPFVKGDFIERYILVKSFKLSENGKQRKEKELLKEIHAFADVINNKINGLTLDKIGNHIYEPLLKENNFVLSDDLKLIPDKLNDGEKKFVRDFAKYLKDNPEKLKGFDIYLMRNVESLKSIGIYLNDDSEVFYPDFILWLISKEKIYINFVDPKGVFGIINFNELTENEKVKIADKASNPTLPNIEKELMLYHNKEFSLNSFLLLRDSSPFGKYQQADWKKKNMISKNIFRLDWHPEDEQGAMTDKANWVDETTYLDWILEKTIYSRKQ